MNFDKLILWSKVGRRLFLLFIVCALLPTTLLAVISFTHVTRQLHEQSEKRLHQGSKAFALSIYERLLFLEADLRTVAMSLQRSLGADHSRLGWTASADIERRFESLVLHSPRHAPALLLGTADIRLNPTSEHVDRLREGKSVLVIQPSQPPPARVFMIRAVDPDASLPSLLVGLTNAEYLWGIGEDSILPPMTQLCVYEQLGTLLICSVPDVPSLPQAALTAMNQTASGNFEWTLNDQASFATFWSLPLKFHFGTLPWKIVMSESGAQVLAPVANFKYAFSWVVLVSLCIVILLSTGQIRRRLVPLEQLKEGTRRIASGDFSARVMVRSGDEFEELGHAFQTMAAQLGRQFHSLETMAALDRAILSVWDIRVIGETVLSRLADLLPCKGASLTLLEAHVTDVALSYSRPAGTNQRIVTNTIPLDEDFHRFLETCPAGILPIADQKFPVFRPFTQQGIANVLFLPIRRQAETFGLLLVGLPTPRSYTDEDFHQARQIADQVAVALANARDISERRRAEVSLQESNERLKTALMDLEATQRQIIMQERLRALGQMAGGIAHDFNNVLSPIVGYSDMLLRNPEDLRNHDRVVEYLKIIRTAGLDAAKVVSRLREFYRPGDPNERGTVVDLNDLVDQAIKLTQPKWKDDALSHGVTIQMDAHLESIPSIRGNEAELREVLVNLLINAVDALDQGGTITLRTGREGDLVVLEVSDTGTGMSEEVRQRCLEPFFSTKGDRGTGLGLSLVYGVVTRHRGTLDIQSERGLGTTFSMRFPALAENDKAKPEAPETPAIPPLRVLVLDDDPRVRQSTAACLISEGHAVDVAANGREGLEKFYARPFDLIITDQGMPEMSGDLFAATVKQISPRMPIIMVTGFDALVRAAGAKPAGVDMILSKPLAIPVLREALATVCRLLPPTATP